VKSKVLSLACVVSLSVSLIAGCGQNDNGGNNTRANNANGVTQSRYNTDGAGMTGTGGTQGGRNQWTTGITGGTGASGYGMRGTTGGTGTSGYGMTGTTGGSGTTGGTGITGGTGTSGYGMRGTTGGTGASGYGMRGTTGGTGTLGYGMTGGGTTGANGQGTYGSAMRGAMGSQNMGGILHDENTLVIGNSVIVGVNQTKGTKGTRNNNYSRSLSQYLGTDTNVLQVSNEKAVKALKRVKASLNTDRKIKDIEQVSSDIKLILKNAKPMKNMNAANNNQ
jgi:hypothetical protein